MTAPQPAHASPVPALPWAVARATLSEEGSAAIGLAASTTDGDTLLVMLLDAGQVVDALRLVAATLPPREGVWWAWAAATHAARLAHGEQLPPAIVTALAATERWIAAPDDANRRAVWQAAQDAGLGTPAGGAGGAAFFTGGSIAPADITPIPPPAGIHATMVFAAVVAACAVDIEHFDALARAFVAQGVEVIRQVGGWEKSVEHARVHHDAMQQQHLAVAQPGASPAAPPPPATRGP